MTNYSAIATCAATGDNFAASLPVVDGLVRIPELSSEDVILHVGAGCSFEQRRAFEWGLIGYVAYRNGDTATAEYCSTRIQALKNS